MNISFLKMQATGNDFILVDSAQLDIEVSVLIEATPKLCDRKFGIGADGILIVAASEHADFEMIYRNPDGSDAGMCGNGGRCFARYISQKLHRSDVSFNVHERKYEANVYDDHVDLGFQFEMQMDHRESGGRTFDFFFSGTEHLIIPTPELAKKDREWLRKEARILRHDQSLSPVGLNVNFYEVMPNSCLALCTYERGVEDFTLACGTGAVATAAHYIATSNFNTGTHSIDLEADGGQLSVSLHFDQESSKFSEIRLIGPAITVFSGVIEI